MDRIAFFRDLAIIIVSAKVCGLIAQKLKAPQVVGEILAELLQRVINGECDNERDSLITLAKSFAKK